MGLVAEVRGIPSWESQHVTPRNFAPRKGRDLSEPGRQTTLPPKKKQSTYTFSQLRRPSTQVARSSGSGACHLREVPTADVRTAAEVPGAPLRGLRRPGLDFRRSRMWSMKVPGPPFLWALRLFGESGSLACLLLCWFSGWGSGI